MHGARTSRGTTTSPYDAQAAMEALLERLRASSGATRMSVWVHEATTATMVPFHQAVVASDRAPAEHAQLRTPIALSATPFFARVVRDGTSTVAHATGRRAADREIERLGIRSAHGEPLVHDGEVIGVLTVEPAAAAAPHLLRIATRELAGAVAEAWARRSEQRRSAQAAVLLQLIESASTAQSLDQLLGVACRQLAELGEVERACVFLLEDGQLVPRIAGDAPGSRHLAETVRRTGVAAAADRGSSLAVPLGRGTDLGGVLLLDSPHGLPFSEDVRRLAAATGAHLGGAMAQIRAASSACRTTNTALPAPRAARRPSRSRSAVPLPAT